MLQSVWRCVRFVATYNVRACSTCKFRRRGLRSFFGDRPCTYEIRMTLCVFALPTFYLLEGGGGGGGEAYMYTCVLH